MLNMEDLKLLRRQIKADLLDCFAELKKIGLIVGIVLAPWIPAYVVKITLVDSHREELANYMDHTLGNMSGYLDTLLTLNNFCRQYNELTPAERDQNKTMLDWEFNHYLLESKKWRAKLSVDRAVTKRYFGPQAADKLTTLLLAEDNYAVLIGGYCSQQRLTFNQLLDIEISIYDIAIKKYPFLKSIAPDIKNE